MRVIVKVIQIDEMCLVSDNSMYLAPCFFSKSHKIIVNVDMKCMKQHSHGDDWIQIKCKSDKMIYLLTGVLL